MFITNILKKFVPIERLALSKKYYIRYNCKLEDDGSISCRSMLVPYKPTVLDVRGYIEKDINTECKNKITCEHFVDIMGTNFVVWLNAENQANYKAACDLAVQTNGENLPYTIRVGYSNDVKYVTFNTVEEILEFWKGCTEHIQNCLKKCWEMKDSIDYSVYDLKEEELL